jgi:putative salt-induced outer membrane protein YdiY
VLPQAVQQKRLGEETMKMDRISCVLAGAGCLLAAVAVGQEKNGWDMSASLGLNMTRGNSETVTLTPEFKAAGKLGSNELKFQALYAYGEAKDQTTKLNQITERRAEGLAQLNRLLSERSFAYVNGEIGYNDLAGVNYRTKLGPGAGYYFLKGDKANLSLEAGATWISDETEAEVETTPGVFDTEIDTSSELFVRAVQKFDIKLGKSAKLWESVEYLPQANDFEIYYLNAEIGLEAAVNGSLSLRTTVGNAHNSNPVPGKEEDDTTVKAALVYTFGGKS